MNVLHSDTELLFKGEELKTRQESQVQGSPEMDQWREVGSNENNRGTKDGGKSAVVKLDWDGVQRSGVKGVKKEQKER